MIYFDFISIRLFIFYTAVYFTLGLSPLYAEDYLIKKDDHSSSPRKVKLFRGTKLEFKAMFNESAIYDLNNVNQFDSNKLYGTSDCGNAHSENSARFGWRWNKSSSKLEIMAFIHRDGKFYFETMGTAELGRVYDYKIEISQDKLKYELTFGGKTISMERGCSDSTMKGYRLFPYFGGDEVAPHDITIKINDSDNFANFAVDLLYPNPTKEYFVFFNMRVEEDLDIGFHIYDMMGRLVGIVDPASYSGDQDYEKQKLPLPDNLSDGMYLIEPFALVDGEKLNGFVASPGKALKLIFISDTQ